VEVLESEKEVGETDAQRLHVCNFIVSEGPHEREATHTGAPGLLGFVRLSVRLRDRKSNRGPGQV